MEQHEKDDAIANDEPLTASKPTRADILAKARAARGKTTKLKYKKDVTGVSRMLWDLIDRTMKSMEKLDIDEGEGLRILSMYSTQLQKIYQFDTTTKQKGDIDKKLSKVLDLIDGKGIDKITSIKNQTPAIQFKKKSRIEADSIVFIDDDKNEDDDDNEVNS